MQNSKKKPHIVILGAGFGGFYTFLNLRKHLSANQVEITIINRTNYFLFTPLLHEVATGGLAHHQVVESIRSITYKSGANLHVAEIKRVDTQNKIVETSVGQVPYDYLVVATGASTNFFNIPGAAEFGLVLKNLSDAIKIRNRLISAFEKAIETKDPLERKKLLTFVLVGGGATGVELAAEMVEFFSDTFRKFFCGKIPMKEISICLVASGPELIQNFHQKMRDQAKKILVKEGVELKLNARVTSVDKDGVTFFDGSRIETDHVFWLAGVAPNVPEADIPFTTNKAGRIIIDQNMKVLGRDNIYAVGDSATFEDESLPMHAQAAVQAAPIVAKNLIAEICTKRKLKLEKFKYRPAGDLVSLGQWQAAGYFFNTLWSGPLAWFIWRTVYLFKFASWPKRIKIAVDWTVDIFYPRDITKA